MTQSEISGGGEIRVKGMAWRRPGAAILGRNVVCR